MELEYCSFAHCIGACIECCSMYTTQRLGQQALAGALPALCNMQCRMLRELQPALYTSQHSITLTLAVLCESISSSISMQCSAHRSMAQCANDMNAAISTRWSRAKHVLQNTWPVTTAVVTVA
eukprot:7816-Heterococcus_DN1.PRE.5